MTQPQKETEAPKPLKMRHDNLVADNGHHTGQVFSKPNAVPATPHQSATSGRPGKMAYAGACGPFSGGRSLTNSMFSAAASGTLLPVIQRMVPAHAMDINGLYSWSVQAKPIVAGEKMIVTAAGPADVQKIRALGFMGIMVLGRHQMHHLGIATGEPMNMHGMH